MRARRRLLLTAIIVAIVLIFIAAFGAWRLLSARQHLERGAAALRAARALIEPSSRLAQAPVRASLRADLVSAHAEFQQAQDELGPFSLLLAQLGWVPRIGGELTAAKPAADVATATTGGAIHLLDGLAPVWPVIAHRGQAASVLPRLTRALSADASALAAAGADLRAAADALPALPAHSGNAALDTATHDLRTVLPSLRAGVDWLRVMSAVLGAHAPSHYLILLQNPAELRATGGFIGAAGFDTLTGGVLRSHFSDSALSHEVQAVPPPLPEAVLTGEGYLLFRDANWSPDFALSARVARWLYGEDTGLWAEGVIGVVDTGVVRLLSATGPVYVPAYGRLVSAANVEALAQLYVHGLPGGGKQFLGAVLDALIGRIETLPSTQWPALGEAVAAAAAARDLQLYDRRSAVEAAIAASRADGRLRPVPGDFLAVVDDNRSYNKLNPYVRESGTYAAQVAADGSVQATLVLDYHVDRSPADLEGEGPGFGSKGTKHDYLDFLRVYVPAGARLVAQSGLDPWAPQSAYGLTQLAGSLLIREGQSQTVTLRYRLPAGTAGSGDYRLTVRRQAGADLQNLQVRVSGTGGVTGQAALHLTVDRTRRLRVPLDGLSSALAVPPTTGAGDPYLPYAYFRDPKHPL